MRESSDPGYTIDTTSRQTAKESIFYVGMLNATRPSTHANGRFENATHNGYQDSFKSQLRRKTGCSRMFQLV